MADGNIQDVSAQKPTTDMSVKSLEQAATNINLELKEKDLASQAQSSGGKYGYIDIARTPINPDLFYLIDADIAEKALCIPFFRVGKTLRVACSDPENEITKIVFEKFIKDGYKLQINLASEEGLLKAVRQFHMAQSGVKQELETEVDENEVEVYQKEIENLSKLADEIKVSSAKEGLNLIEIGAIKTGASDIHFQPEESEVLIRFRIDGILQNVTRLSKEVYNQLAQQIKYDSGMTLNASNVPQDGRMSFQVNDRKVDVRVSALPTDYGETLVLRILDSGKKFLDFKELGFNDEHLAILDQISHLSQGMILVTGPTGSGKTTTLYTMLSKYNTPEKKIITLEDPVEYQIANIVQSQINEEEGYTFSEGLESILRQDPDVVMIGEIRDLDTANTATQAALTGHVMLSTLHTNSAIESVARLVNLGMNPYMLSPALDTIMAQRLVRTFCEHCKKDMALGDEDRAYLEKELVAIEAVTGQAYQIPETLPSAAGCDKCNHTGFLGRMVIAEIVRVDEKMREMINEGASVTELEEYAVSLGMLNMKQDGIIKVVEGKTALDEVRRVTD